MATSGVYDFNLTRDEIISAALRKLEIYDPDPAQISYADEALNLIVKSLQSYNVFLWAREWVTKGLTASSVVVGTDGLQYTCIRSHTASSANKPVTGAEWRMYWAQEGTGGAVWADTTAYSCIGDFTVAVETIAIDKMMVRDVDTDSDMDMVTSFDYLSETDKRTTGKPVKAWVEKQIPPVVRVWPIPDKTTYVLHYLRVRKLQDFSAADDNADFDVRWLEFLIYKLAHRLSPEYMFSIERQVLLKKEADELYILAKRGNREETSFDFVESAY